MTARQPRKRPRKGTQLALELAPRTWGGARPGAGRKPGPTPRVPRRSRAAVAAEHPVHATLRVLDAVPSLRRKAAYREIRAAMRRSGHRDHFRICHYAVAGNHLHLICEADDAGGLARGIQGFASLAARRLNRRWGRRGQVFADRYHARALATPRDVRQALVYVLNNWRHHRMDAGHDWPTDPFSSGALFDGWSEPVEPPEWLDPGERRPIAVPRTWLLGSGWKKAGPISPREIPGPRRRR